MNFKSLLYSRINIDAIIDKRNNMFKSINEDIEEFYNKEIFQYLNYKKEKPGATFKLIYKRIGEEFYKSPEVITELEKRFNNALLLLEEEKKEEKRKNKPIPIPKIPKQKNCNQVRGYRGEESISKRGRIKQLLDFDPTLSNKQISSVLNISYNSVCYHVTILNRIKRANQRKEIQAQEKINNRKQIQSDLGLTETECVVCLQNLRSILNNW